MSGNEVYKKYREREVEEHSKDVMYKTKQTTTGCIEKARENKRD